MRVLLLIASTIGFCLGTVVATAQSTARTGTDHAIFFVVQDYDAWPDFPNSSTQQVRDIEQELQNNYGFKTEFLFNPTRKQIVDKLTKDLAKRSFQKDDQLLVYFSMHGHYEEGSQGALIPKDGLLEDASFDSWITHPNLAAWLNTIPCEHMLLSLDACYSGTFGGSRGAKPDKKPWETENDCSSKAAKALQYKSRLYVTSGGLERTPTDSQFAKKWLEVLRVRNMNGLLSFHSLFGVLSEASPAPMFGNFGSHAPGGDFILIDKTSCKKVPILNHEDHWRQIESNPSKSLILEHLRVFQGCSHEHTLITYLSGTQPKSKVGPKGALIYDYSAPIDLAKFVYVKGGPFNMGSTELEKLLYQDTTISVSNYYIGKNEITFEEYDIFCNATKRSKPDDMGWGRGNRPVINVNLLDVVAYCNWRSKEDGLQEVYEIKFSTLLDRNLVIPNWNANGYRLPTEGEWEYAARSGGKEEKWSGTSLIDSLSLYANFGRPSHFPFPDSLPPEVHDGYQFTAPVGTFRPNGLGLYDMSGNVWEFCLNKGDEKYREYYDSDGVSDEVARGGGFGDGAFQLRCANRFIFHEIDNKRSKVGFRLARNAH